MSAHGRPDSFMPLYIGDYLRDTGRLTTCEHGAYLLLLMAYWCDGALPDDDADLAAIAKADTASWRKLRPRLVRFFEVEGGFWHHARVDRELARANHRYERAVHAATSRWGQGKLPLGDAPSTTHGNAAGNAPGFAEGMPGEMLNGEPEQCQPQPHPQGIESDPQESLSNPRRAPAPARRGAAPAHVKSVVAPEWTGPPEIRTAVVDRMGEVWAVTWFDACEWDAEGRVVLAPRGLSVDRLIQNVRRELRGVGVEDVRLKGPPE